MVTIFEINENKPIIKQIMELQQQKCQYRYWYEQTERINAHIDYLVNQLYKNKEKYLTR